jgi:hypothetical protein
LLGLVGTVQQLVTDGAGGGAGQGSLGMLGLAARALRKARPPLSARRAPPKS